ncbi:hypothetical protein T484DRAFT_1768123 [Baffinella frigidus]|nr:hypothetical protein T484DRAFT_1768123 [Cryptophyta sp. CCMP2293]
MAQGDFNASPHKGYAQDENGVHHINVEAPIECPPDSTAFATFLVFSDQIIINGRGVVPSRTLPFRTPNQLGKRPLLQ